MKPKGRAPLVRWGGRRRRRCEGDGGRADFSDAELADDAGDVAAVAVARDLARGAAIPAGGGEGGGGGGGGSPNTTSGPRIRSNLLSDLTRCCGKNTPLLGTRGMCGFHVIDSLRE